MALSYHSLTKQDMYVVDNKSDLWPQCSPASSSLLSGTGHYEASMCCPLKISRPDMMSFPRLNFQNTWVQNDQFVLWKTQNSAHETWWHAIY